MSNGTSSAPDAVTCKATAFSGGVPYIGSQSCKPLTVAGMNAAQTWKLVRDQVEYMNQVYKRAGIQFYIKSFEHFLMPHIVGACVTGNTTMTWSDAKDDLYPVTLWPDTAFATGTTGMSKRVWDWIEMSATFAGNADEILVWIPPEPVTLSFPPPLGTFKCPGFGAGHGQYPNAGRGVTVPIDQLYSFRTMFAHEMGHFFGLPHAFDNISTNDFTAGRFRVPMPAAYGAAEKIIDPITDAEITHLGYFWDLVRGTGANSQQFFTSATDAYNNSSLGVNLQTKLINYDDFDNIQQPTESWHYVDSQNNCTLGGTRDTLTCFSSGPPDITYTLTDPPGPPSAFFTGVGFSSTYVDAGQKHIAGNLMSYGTGAGDIDPIPGLSESQIRHVRNSLRYEVTNRGYTNLSQNPTIGGTYQPTPSSRRTLLGRPAFRSMMRPMDFDADGIPDVGVWGPPTSGMTGDQWVFTVRLSSQAFNNPISCRLGRAGDIPIPYNNDHDFRGATEFAVYQPGGGANYDAPDDTDASWRVRVPSYTYSGLFGTGNITGFSCSDSSSLNDGTIVNHLGERGDIPLAGLDFDEQINPTTTKPTNTEVAIFRPSNSTFYWCTIGASNCNTGSTPYSKWVGPSAGIGVIPIPGLFNSVDNRIDLATFDPASASFYQSMSGSVANTYGTVLTSSWTSNHSPHPPPGTAQNRSGSIPLVDMGEFLSPTLYRNYIGLWDPVDRAFTVNTGIAPNISQPGAPWPCLFGTNTGGEMVVQGYFDRNGDGISDLLLFSPGDGSAGSAKLLIRSRDCSSFDAPVPPGLTSTSLVRVAGDVNGDGATDLWIINTITMEWRLVVSNVSSPASAYRTTTTTFFLGNNADAVL